MKNRHIELCKYKRNNYLKSTRNFYRYTLLFCFNEISNNQIAKEMYIFTFIDVSNKTKKHSVFSAHDGRRGAGRLRLGSSPDVLAAA